MLLVEDDPDVQLVASLALADIGGLTVEVCGSANEALEVAYRFRPDMILMDVMMPEVDGITAFQMLRKIPTFASTPVVFMTARARASEVAAYRELGALGVITKPFEPATLAETLRGLWNERVD